MSFFSVFLSVVIVIHKQESQLEEILTKATRIISPQVSDYELIVVFNGAQEECITTLKHLTGECGLPNLQVFTLTQEVDSDTAAWVGLENALGDFIAGIDPMVDDIEFLPQMLAQAMDGADVVFATNTQKPKYSIPYRLCYMSFQALYKLFNGIHLANEAPQYRVLSKRVVNFILQHPSPAMSYRHLPATGGFPRANLTYNAHLKTRQIKHLGESIDRGMRLLVSTKRGPMRLVTSLSLFGAVSNLVYSVYVIGIALLKPDVAPGWVTLSLQQSGMFFLISLVLLVLGEYILHMAHLSNEGPLYHIAQEFTSAVITRQNKLNIETVQDPDLRDNHPESTVGAIASLSLKNRPQ